jgi:hypothetical protein
MLVVSPDLMTSFGYANIQAEKFLSVTSHGQLYKTNLYEVLLNYARPELNFKLIMFTVLSACHPKKQKEK